MNKVSSLGNLGRVYGNPSLKKDKVTRRGEHAFLKDSVEIRCKEEDIDDMDELYSKHLLKKYVTTTAVGLGISIASTLAGDMLYEPLAGLVSAGGFLLGMAVALFPLAAPPSED